MKVKLTIGDGSSDGHGKSEVFVYDSNKTVEEIRQAYKDSCKLTGLSFNHNQDYTELKLDWQHPEYNDRKIATEYDSNTISKLAEKILLTYGIDVWEGFDKEYFEEDDIVYIDGVEHFIDLWLKFVRLSLPDLILDEASFKKSELSVIPTINSSELNVQFGYGIFS